jgi:hypothetical protein
MNAALPPYPLIGVTKKENRITST